MEVINLSTRLKKVARLALALFISTWGASQIHANGHKEKHDNRSIWLPRVEILDASYPEDCRGNPASQGICLLGSENPKADTTFLVRQVITPANGDALPGPLELKLNEQLELPLGVFEIFRSDRIDEFKARRFQVTDGQVVTIKTATLELPEPMPRLLALQRFNPESKITGFGCKSLLNAKSVEAVLPGTYHVTRTSNMQKDEKECLRSGYNFLLEPGETVTLGLVKFKKKFLHRHRSLPSEHVYSHHTGAQALTNIGRARHPVTHIALAHDVVAFDSLINPSRFPSR